MNAPAKITAPTEPKMLADFRALPDIARHKVLQLLIAEFGLADREADLFLAAAAWELANGNEDRASDLYPKGCISRDGWDRHNAQIARDVMAYEQTQGFRIAKGCGL
ncbi:hypothetical protein [Rhizorhabdus wittichii]|uniref:hypothetical protein n=1 Tax=Rhizorhabdus wittichii TaxID=160791 RepID=UPI0002F17FBF|nr:hypothetical protein [Rhizorhabdus wittichii]